MWQGEVIGVYIADQAEAPIRSLNEVRAIKGVGLEGDRYAKRIGTYSYRSGPGREVTLIEAETIEAVRSELKMDLDYGATRRNIVVRGAALNHLVGRRFRVGNVVLVGTRLCEPCNYLERLTNKRGLMGGLVHRGGVRADIVEEGVIRVGDPVCEA